MRALALDLGKTTGFAYANGAQRRSMFEEFPAGVHNVYPMFWRQLTRLLDHEKIEEVVYEDPKFNRGFSYIPGLIALLIVACKERDIPTFACTVQEVKKTATGKGNATKEEMKAALPDEMRLWVADQEDAIDAAWVLEWYLRNRETTGSQLS